MQAKDKGITNMAASCSLIERLAELAGKTVEYQIEENASASKATYALLDTTKIKSLGWEPQYTVKEGLARTFWIKKADHS